MSHCGDMLIELKHAGWTLYVINLIMCALGGVL